MQKIIIEKPYQYVPPQRGTMWSTITQKLDIHTWFLKKYEGIHSHECRNLDRLRQSIDAGHGILLAPNHCRTADPLAMGWICQGVGCHFFGMASWHLFNQSALMTWAIRNLGAFSVNREGVDRQAINEAIRILETAERPLVIFPEGAVSRTNDRLHALLDGVAFIARTAAKKRAKKNPDAKVVVHPVAIKYFYEGDIKQTVSTVLEEIEHRLSWKPQADLPLIDRTNKVGHALLCLKEVEYFGAVQSGSFQQRLEGLINRLLNPLEEEWLGEPLSGPVVPRVKSVRVKMLPDMVEGRIDEAERERRWSQLADLYLAQQVSCYQPDYITNLPSVDRVLETIERYEEDLTDKAKIHGQLKCVIDIGEAQEVNPKRDKSAPTDPLMQFLETEMQSMLDELAKESPLVD